MEVRSRHGRNIVALPGNQVENRENKPQPKPSLPTDGRNQTDKAKPFYIPKKLVWLAYKKVKENKGAAGVDDQSIEDFEKDLKNNLYKIWNRMSSGSYFPSPVKMVEANKNDGGVRKIGISTVADRIAQTVVKMYLEPDIDPIFHPDSFGYRPEKSAIEAVRKTRERCWKYRWLVDLDIRKFFDSIDRELLWKAIRKHTQCKWILLYIQRWFDAYQIERDGTKRKLDKGTIQGAVISPILANLFLHYAFDEWMRRNFPSIPFARFADDIVVHCNTEKEAETMLKAIRSRLAECRLELHPEKTKIVYCKSGSGKGDYPNITFDFLGYTFKPRRCRNRKGKQFTGFTPAVSNKASKKMRQKVRSWKLQRRTGKTLEDLSEEYSAVLRGWINYFSKFYKSAIYPTMQHFNRKLALWAKRKYKKFKGSMKRAMKWIKMIAKRDPKLFPHWQMGIVEAGR